MSLELIRSIILFTGWPFLIIGSIIVIIKARNFYIKVQGTIFAKLVPSTIIGWLISMFCLGIVATVFMQTNLELGVKMVTPIFLIWIITMILALVSMNHWSKEAVTINIYYGNLEKEIKERTKDLEDKVNQLEKLNKLMVGREIRIKELKQKVTQLKRDQE